MRPIGELLEELVRRGCEVRLEDHEVRLRAPPGALDDGLRTELATRRDELARSLRGDQAASQTPPPPAGPLDFSLFFFAEDSHQPETDRYRLLLDATRFADAHGFRAVWTPERHFHPLGGLYPNPATISAALAMITTNLRLRAGSVVLPLHDPLRVAEEWAVVDNLSGGRVEVGFASGWHVDDFALAPDAYGSRRRTLFEGIETVRALWRGEAVTRRGGAGNSLELRTRPRPVQPELPVWITAVANPETYREAGRLGADLLTCLLSQDLDELCARLPAYRAGRAEGGHDPKGGRVAVFLHTFLGDDRDRVKHQVRSPFTAYLSRTLELVGNIGRSAAVDLRPDDLDAEDKAALLEYTFERYFESRSLMGTPESVSPLLNQLVAAGVAEVACLVDFGLAPDRVLAGLVPLGELARSYAPVPGIAPRLR